MRAIHKRFGPAIALRGVDLSVEREVVHALIGENGAGKSTLMKILAGGLTPDSGAMLLDGKPFAPRSPRAARARGVSMIYQELTLAPHLSVEENISLGVERARFGVARSRRDEAVRALGMLGYDHVDPRTPVKRLGIGEQQIVEIARALVLDSSLVIMDEPTSSLSARDTRALFAVIRRLRARGVTILYISHFLEEVLEIADRFTVMRDGAVSASGKTGDRGIGDLITAMVGRSLDQMFPKIKRACGPPVFEARDVCARPRVRGVSFQVHAGEILGIAGLVGAGRTETARVLFGLDPAESGVIRIGDRSRDLTKKYSSAAAIGLGLSMVSEDRKEEGLALNLSIRDNMTLAALKRFAVGGRVVRLRRERAAAASKAAQAGIKCASVEDPVEALSGGNQQKAAFARILLNRGAAFILDEPTRGIDVGSKVELYRLIGSLAASGAAIVLISSYLPELFGICDTLAVMHRGRLSVKRPVEQWNEERVMTWAATGKEEYDEREAG
jgi:ribose transport system ATP-binding protein